MAQAAVAEKLSGIRKAAILMVLMGEKAATAVLRQLPQKQVERLMREIASVGEIDPEVSREVLREFTELAVSGNRRAQGNSAYAQKLLVEAFGEPAGKHLEIDPEVSREVLREFTELAVSGNRRAQGNSAYAQKLLVEAFGEPAGKQLFERAMRPSDLDPTDPDILEKADPHQLSKLLENESPQVIALVVAHLSSGLASQVLNLFPEKLKSQVVERMARMRAFPSEVVKRTLATVSKKVAVASNLQQLNFGGINVVAKLLKSMDPTSSRGILESIKASDPDLLSSINALMFTFEDLKDVTEAGIRELIGHADKKTLSLALKGAHPDIQAHIFKCMSSRAVEMLKENMEALGPVRLRDVTQAQQEITRLAHELEDEGKLMRKSADSNDTIL